MSEITILVVEPDAVLLHNVAENILRPQGFYPLKAQSLANGIKAVQAGSPDLILLHTSGKEVRSFLESVVKINGRIIPTILVVDQSETKFDVRLLRLGLTGYVTWPLVPEELLQTIKELPPFLSPSQMSGALDGQHLKLEFANMASHLMRNPLFVIQTSVNCLQTLNLSLDEEKTLLDKIWRQSQQLSTFINELLKMFQVDVDSADTYIYNSPVNLPPIIEQVTTKIQVEEPDKQILVNVNADTLPAVAADSTKTEIILSTLLKGAAQRCLEGGQIFVNVEPDTTEIIVSIKDNGEPIPLQSIENIFQPYYSTGYSQMRMPSDYQLGLYATKRLVELQHGRIWAKALAENSGSEFNFSLPIWKTSELSK